MQFQDLPLKHNVRNTNINIILFRAKKMIKHKDIFLLYIVSRGVL